MARRCPECDGKGWYLDTMSSGNNNAVKVYECERCECVFTERYKVFDGAKRTESVVDMVDRMNSGEMTGDNIENWHDWAMEGCW